jgi:hypothetical protein
MYDLIKYGSVGLCLVFIIYAIYLTATGKAKFQQKKK